MIFCCLSVSSDFYPDNALYQYITRTTVIIALTDYALLTDPFTAFLLLKCTIMVFQYIRVKKKSHIGKKYIYLKDQQMNENFAVSFVRSRSIDFAGELQLLNSLHFLRAKFIMINTK